ncbi:MAG: hypothetical protein S4CHLAM81_13740 [Chlamydiales bacterium]|nr:hypothetical protein [Chlamydiales bacterium]MCH9636146.1 hypothetical protein [Chlamydiales bacterium]MCH9703257.1 hypothetical protein [Chlamydiota bacterium]
MVGPVSPQGEGFFNKPVEQGGLLRKVEATPILEHSFSGGKFLTADESKKFDRHELKILGLSSDEIKMVVDDA